MSGGSTKKTTQNQQTSNVVTLPPWMTQAGEQNFNDAAAYNRNNPVQAYTGPMTAGLTPNQQQASEAARNAAGQGQGDVQAARLMTMLGATGPSVWAQAPQVDAQSMTPTTQRVVTGTAAQQGGAPTVGAPQESVGGYNAVMTSATPMVGAGAAQAHDSTSFDANAFDAQSYDAQARAAQARAGQAYDATAFDANAFDATAHDAQATDAQAALARATGYDAYTVDQGQAPIINAMQTETGRWDAAAADRYMDPYLGKVQDHVLERMRRSQAEERAGLNDGVVGAKAFGGTRQGVLESMLRGDQRRQVGEYLDTSSSDAYRNAQAMFTSDEGRLLQSGIANQTAKLQGDVASGNFLMDLLGGNREAINRSREISTGRETDVSVGNADRETNVSNWNADRRTNISDNNAQRRTDISDRNAGRRTDISDSNATRRTNTSENNAQRRTDVSVSDADRFTDVDVGNADRFTDVDVDNATRRTNISDSNATRRTNVSENNAGRRTNTSENNAARRTGVDVGNVDRTLAADQGNQRTQQDYDFRNADADTEARRWNQGEQNAAGTRNADRRYNAELETARFLDTMLGRNMEADQGMRLENLGYENRAAEGDANRGQEASRLNADWLNRILGENADRTLSASTTNSGVQQSVLDRLLRGGSQMADLGVTSRNLSTADIQDLMRTGAMEQGTNQAGLDANYGEFLRMQNAGMDRYQTLAQILAGTPKNVSTSGTMSGTTVEKSKPDMLNQILGAAMTAASFIPSDRRLKRDIALIGRLASGLGIYLFRYIWDDDAAPLRRGVMVDEVARIVPEALGPTFGGFGTVNYSMLGAAL